MGLRELAKRSSVTDWLIALFTLVLVVVSAHQGCTMRGQMADAEAQFTISHRPWVGIEEFTSSNPLVFDSDGVHTQVSFTVKNAGNSPALNATSQGHLVVKAYAFTDMHPLDRLVNDIHFVCAPDFTSASHKLQIGLFLLPGQAEPFPLSEWTVRKEDIPVGDLVEVYLVGCIGYSDESNGQHGTSFVYQYIATSAEKAFRPNGTVAGSFQNFGLSKAY